ncbi:MAG: hypothetical protein H6671_09380 [Anaerolineaceae bacterium]|nr:hypothetical protein [Anaerolineaceae bacterium]
MKRGFSQAAKHFITRGERGQTIVILAFGIVVLLAFVGIVTDVSLMFVRFSTLRRAVDSAAVAAAGQVRRLVPERAEWEKAGGSYAGAVAVASNFGRSEPIESDWVSSGADRNVANGLAFARNIAQVKLAAESFIEFYGLNPTGVLVETCATTPGDSDLCTEDQRKLIRVTAQIASPTVFLRLIGWGNITLESESLSETAVLDVVLIMDVSESMLSETTYDNWERVPDGSGGITNLGWRYVPPLANGGYTVAGGTTKGLLTQSSWPGGYTELWTYMLNHSQSDLDNDSRFDYPRFVPAGSGTPDGEPRPECRVRFYPNAQANKVNLVPGDTLEADIEAYLTSVEGGAVNYPSYWDGFMPAYNFYGCCNDPNGDWNFNDLICQPFRQARDATAQFLQRIDFVRGDRVAFVTFDRSAYLMLPEHTAGNGAAVSHMIDNEVDATNLLNKAVGVRAEPNFYADTNDDGLWDSYVTGGEYGIDPAARAILYDTATWGFDAAPLGQVQDYPVYNACPFTNASLLYPFSIWSVPGAGGALPTAVEQPDYYYSPLNNIMNPNGAAWINYLAAKPTGIPYISFYSYELRASCRGTNMGAALRTANNALADPNTIRETGSVWVMVLLSDGAAGASDPATRAGQPVSRADPYRDPAYDPPNYPNDPQPGEYGAYGVCPYGYPDNPGELVQDLGFPYCSDKLPETRHFCISPDVNFVVGPQGADFYIDLDHPDPQLQESCRYAYDVDDYARDWADYVGLNQPFPWALVSDQTVQYQRPTIFTIGFGLQFSQGSGSCADNVADCLGEELLRYIADVGDNQQIDTDYQQDVLNDKVADFTVSDTFGGRGPCEGPILSGELTADEAKANGRSLSDIINPLPPGQSCGNYYNAPSGRELEVVFDDIASRMFTQLAR